MELNNKTTKKGKPSAGIPIFLRKSYDMINTCDDTIATWYDGGRTFVVKDTERFGAEVIPDYFKHNNFSSFVRQLNFYGFRKIKSVSLRIADVASSDESRFWKFRHEKFQRGRPDMLTEIRKNSSENADKHEVDQLKNEVRDLKGALTLISADMAKLKTLVGRLYPGKESFVQKSGMRSPEAASKKRKVLGDEYLVSIPSCDSLNLAVQKVLPSSLSHNSNSSWADMKCLQSDAMLKAFIGKFPGTVTSTASLAPIPPRSSVGTGNSEWPDMSRVHIQSATARTRNESVNSQATDDDVSASHANSDESELDVFAELETTACLSKWYHQV